MKGTRYEWLPLLPDHWDAARLARFARVETGGTPDRQNPEYWSEGTIPWVASGEVNKGIITNVDERITELGMRSSNARMLPRGTVVIALNGQGKTKGTAALLAVEATCNQSIAGVVCDDRRLDPRFFYYYASAKYREIRGLAGEQRDGLSLPDIRLIPVPIPPLTEQRAIADFLDRETAKIDALIAHRQRLARLLSDRLATRISEMMKALVREAGCVKLKRLLAAPPRNGISPTITSSGDIPTFSLAAIREGLVAIGQNLKFAGRQQPDYREFEVRRGDVLVVRGNGSRELVGAAGLVSEIPPSGCIYPDLLIRLQPGECLSSAFLVEFINSSLAREQIEASAQTASGIWKITGCDIGGILIPPATRKRQAEIEAEISALRDRSSATIAALGKSEALLLENRSAAVTAAVTGQIDGRQRAGFDSQAALEQHSQGQP